MRFLSLHTYGSSVQKLLVSPVTFFFPQKFKWSYILLAVIFPAAFFLIFKPFGIFNPSGGNLQNVVVAGYGIVSGVMAFLFFTVFPTLAKRFFKTFNVGKALVYFLLFFLVLAVANYVYKTTWCGQGDYSWGGFWVVFKRTILIGVLPLALLVIWEKNRALKNTSTLIHPPPSLLAVDQPDWILYSENRKEMIRLSQDRLLFVESADNYVEVHCAKNGHSEKQLLRTTLHKVEKEIESLVVMRCHRSFVVNLQKVTQATGNSRGLLLALEGTSKKIPVSRRYVPVVSDKLNLGSSSQSSHNGLIGPKG